MNEFFQNRKVARVFIVLFWSASIALVSFALSSLKEFTYIGSDIQPVTTISVSGKGETFAMPDIAQFSFSVVKEAKTVPEAQKQSAELSNLIIGYLKTVGIDSDKDIKTTNYSVNPKYEWHNVSKQIVCITAPCPPIIEGKSVLVGYEVNQTVSVKVRKVEKAGELLGGVGEKGATNISGLEFTVDDIDKAEREARQKAIVDAKEKADMLARDLGVRLSRIVSYSESGGNPVPIMFRSMGLAKADSGESISPEVPAGENKIVSNVSIVYEIR